MKTNTTAAIRCTVQAAILAVAFTLLPAPSHAQTVPVDYTRPFIWVRASERAGIVEKINTQAWATSVYNALVSRVASPVASHQANRDAYLRQLPVNWTATPPVIRTTTMRGEVAPRFTEALDCAVLYYITQDGKYARLAADLLHNAVKTIAPLPDDGLPGNNYLGDGGQSRCVGTQLPIIYDLLHPYLLANQVYDVETATMVNFNFGDAQTVFRACYKDVWLNGNGNNHSGFHSHMVFNNMLALDDTAERDTAIQAFISSRQRNACSIAYVNDRIAEADDIWPECFNYTGVMNSGFTYHMLLLERIDPSLKLFETYPAIPASFHRRSQFRYPNGDLIQHGHTHRDEGGLSYGMLEQAYAHALARGYTGQAQFWGGLIKNGTQTGEYNRSITINDIAGSAFSARKENLQLLLQVPTIDATAAPLPEPRTDDLVYAGITMQRNPAPTNNVDYGLMCFVGGAGYTHGHASGMNIELYGMGLVMGRKGHAESERSSDLHNNFDRIFGGANTIIVNGASMGYGGHAWLAINKVQNVAMEPQPFATALSTSHSFTVSSFLDDKGDKAEGTQQRMLSIIRTSPTSGFYVDIFRSKSAVTNRTAITLDGPVTNQYHDYIYRNIGETNITVQTAGGALPLSPQPARFQDTSAFTSRYKFPGTVHFTNPMASYRTNVAFRTQFAATVSGITRYMDMHMPSVASREIVKVDSPPFSDAPAPYHTKNAPTLVVRQIGDAWDKPFVAVYEPHFGAADGTIQNIETLEQGGLVVGVKVESLVQGTNITQYVLSHPDGNGVISYPSLGIEFRGRFAVITDRDDNTGELYLGEGTLLEYGGYVVKSADGATAQASVRFAAGGVADIASNDSIIVSDAGSGRIVGPNAVAHNPFSMALTKSMFPPLPSSGGATFSKVSGPAWLGVAANGAVSGAPANVDVGLNSFTVKASNGIDPDVTTTLDITVLPDTTPPAALSFSPGNGAVAAPVDGNPRVTFSENVAFGTGMITLRRVSDDTVVESFDVANPPAGLILSGATVTINPTANLDYITGYYLLVDATAIKDLSDNAFPGISGKTEWTFTTAIEPVFRTWTGASYAAYWSHAANWTPAGDPAGEGYHVIYYATGAARLTQFLHENYTIGWITFNDLADSAVTLRLYRNDDSARSLTMGGTYNRTPIITVDAGSAGNHIIGANGTEIVTPGNLILAGNLTVAHNGSGTLTINRPITQSGTRSLTKTGSGTLVLSGASTYTGPTAVNGGKLQLAGGSNRLSTATAMTLADVAGVVFDLNGQNQTLGSLAGGGSIGGNITLGAGLLTVGNATNTTYAGVISGSGGLAKQGDGSLTLTGANNYNGATTVNGGTLILGVANALPANSPLILGGGALDVGNLSPSLGTLAVTGNATLTLVDGAGTLSFADSSSASWTGSLTLLSQDGPLRPNRVRFGTSATALTTDQLARISLDGQRLTLDANGYLVGAVSSTYFWDNNGTTAGFGDAGGTWDEPTLDHWTLSPNGTGTPQASLNTSTTDSLNFGNGATGLGEGTIAIPYTVEAGSLTFASGSGPVTLTGGIIALGDEATITVANSTNTISSQLSGATASVTKTGTGILTLAGANTVYGATVIADGILELAHEDALLHSPLDTANSVAGQASKGLRTTLNTLKLGGLTGSKNLADVFTTTAGGYSGVTQITLNVALGKDLVYSGIIDGGKTLTKTGAGSQTLTGASVFGSTTLEDGTLAFGPNNVSLGTLTVTGNATLAPGSGSLTFADSSSIPWTGTLTLTGSLGAQTLRFGTSATALTAAQLASITVNGNSATLDVNGYLGQMGDGIYTSQTDAWNLPGSWQDGIIAGGTGNTAFFTNDVTATSTTSLGANFSIGHIVFTDADNSTANGFNRTLSNNILTLDVDTGAPSINVTQSGRSLTIASTIAGNKGLTKIGPGSLHLNNAANTYTGKTLVNGGRIRFNAANSLGANPASFVADQLTLNGGSLYVTGTSAFGNRGITLGAGGGGFIANGGANFTVPVPIAGIGSLTKENFLTSNPSTLTLSAANTYTGSTIINVGTLVLANTGTITDSASVSIVAGGVLDTAAKTSFALAAAQPFGLGINAAAAGTSGSIIAQELVITNAVVSLNITGTLDDPAYVLATYTSLTGTNFASVSGLPANYVINYAYQGNKIALVPVVQSPYDIWSGGAAFDGDANGDGVANGMAFLLGASGPTVNALALLPAATATADGGGLVLTFTLRNASNRGGLVLNLQHSSDLGINDPWTTVVVPETSGGPFNGVTFTITPGGTLNTVVATISPDEAADGKIFSRLQAVDP